MQPLKRNIPPGHQDFAVQYQFRCTRQSPKSPTPYQLTNTCGPHESYSFSPSPSPSLSILSPPTPDASSPPVVLARPIARFPPLSTGGGRRAVPRPSPTALPVPCSLPHPSPSLSPAPSPHPPRSSGHLHRAKLVLPPIEGGSAGSKTESTRRRHGLAHLHRAELLLPSIGRRRLEHARAVARRSAKRGGARSCSRTAAVVPIADAQQLELGQIPTAATPPSLCCPDFLSLLFAMARTTTTVAHVLHRTGFGGCGMGTGLPVSRSARRCGVKNCKCVLQHAVGFGVAYPVRPALDY
jgi:hypothetical protein